MRRTRATDWSRRLHAETVLTPANLIWPLFVTDSEAPEPIASLPGVSRWPVAMLAERAREAATLGIPCLALFPNTPPGLRSDDGREAFNPDNLMCRAIRSIKDAVPDIGILSDVALDPYTSHGHDGLTDARGYVLNDATAEALVRQALVQAEAGTDIVAPSDMMDGRVGAVRSALDDAGHQNVMIMAYAAKYASAFYGPFRDAVKAGASLGSSGKSSYQMDPANSDEAMHEIDLDLQEGADMVIIKPGMPYLDILNRAKTEFGVPCIAYQVSGEYAMIVAAAKNGWLDHDRSMMESMTAFKRAGADAVITYFAPQIAKILLEKKYLH